MLWLQPWEDGKGEGQGWQPHALSGAGGDCKGRVASRSLWAGRWPSWDSPHRAELPAVEVS